MSKTCVQCNQIKPLGEFYKHPSYPDGLLKKCKECIKGNIRENRARNVEHYREYDRIRGSRMTSDDTKKQRKNHPEWLRAHNAVQKAKMKGILKKLPCAVCGASNTHAHHEDYSKPLDVIWLCPLHHRMVHAGRLDVTNIEVMTA